MSPHTTAAERKAEFIKSAQQALGSDAVRVLDPNNCTPKEDIDKPKGERDGEGKNFNVRCATDMGMKPLPTNLQNDKNPVMIKIGLDGEIPRWRKGATVRWAAFASGYDEEEDAVYAATSMQMAAEEWNKLDVGVKFEQVGNLEDANFALGYGGQPWSRDRVLAEAYFPNNQDLNDLIVYKLAFSDHFKHDMWRVFLHELGHVLGLRHEFAIQREGRGAVSLGRDNEKSVMTYDREAPVIQPSDVEATKAFYDLTGPLYNGRFLKIYDPDN